MFRYKRKKKRSFTKKSLILINLIAAISLLISYSASFIDPSSFFWPIAFFGLAYLPLLLINLGFIILWFFLSRKYILLSFLSIVVGWSLLTKHFKISWPADKLSEETVEKEENSLRVMSFNAHLFKPIDEEDTVNFENEAIQIIKEVKPDIISFQEFYTQGKTENNTLQKIKNAGGFSAHYFDIASQNKADAYGQVIFSKYPIIHAGTISEYNYGINRLSYADILRGEDTLRVYNVHLRSFALQNADKKFFQRLAQSEIVEDKPKNLLRKLKTAFNGRSEQAASLRNHIKKNKHYPKIVLGDFNDTPMSYAVNKISKNMHNAFQEKGRGWGVTHFDLMPIFQIDYILTTKDIDIVNYHVVKKKLSDHYPIWSDLSIKDSSTK